MAGLVTAFGFHVFPDFFAGLLYYAILEVMPERSLHRSVVYFGILVLLLLVLEVVVIFFGQLGEISFFLGSCPILINRSVCADSLQFLLQLL